MQPEPFPKLFVSRVRGEPILSCAWAASRMILERCGSSDLGPKLGISMPMPRLQVRRLRSVSHPADAVLLHGGSGAAVEGWGVGDGTQAS